MLHKDTYKGFMLIIMRTRSDIHPTTWDQALGTLVPDQWHATMSMKTAADIQARVHRTAHAYTTGTQDFLLQHMTFGGTKPDAVVRANQKPIWPQNLFRIGRI